MADRSKAVVEEVERLLSAGSIAEVRYPEWLANPVVVKKKNGKWRMCVDFTDLNKACPKDSYPLPNIDRLVESTAGNEMLTFMDAFSGYNQIDPACRRFLDKQRLWSRSSASIPIGRTHSTVVQFRFPSIKQRSRV